MTFFCAYSVCPQHLKGCCPRESSQPPGGTPLAAVEAAGQSSVLATPLLAQRANTTSTALM